MSGSRQATWWEKLLHLIPGTTIWCPGYNRHFRWNKVCFCVKNENLGGVLLHSHGNYWVSFTAGILLEGRKPDYRVKR